MTKTSISYDQAKMLSNITRAYLNEDHSVRHLYNLPSTPENVIDIIQEKESSISCNRQELVKVLFEQYSNVKMNEAVEQNIKRLKHKDTYTITTGHQLNLFTGPLYFIYKIISAIKTANDLNKRYTEYHFVPIYWMATEDHDFEEINHTYIQNQKLTWDSKQTGMVGAFNLKDIRKVLGQLAQILDDSILSKEIITGIENAYLGNRNLSDATRDLVNALFEKYGLVIIDGNNKSLKKTFSSIVESELFESKSHDLVVKSINTFPEKCNAQVNPREINLFYLNSGIRERIVKYGSEYEINNTEIKFTAEELLIEVKTFPERFSPNVILRPVYQELVLPNVMYIGGGAEVAYWLELKSVFDYYNITYPLLQIRNSFTVLSEKIGRKIESCDLEWKDLFLKLDEQLKVVLRDDVPFTEEVESLKVELDKNTTGLISKIENYDPNLTRSIAGRKSKILKELTQLEKTIFKSVKRKQADKIRMVSEIRAEIYPQGVFQERRVNIVDMIQKYGGDFIPIVYAQSESFDKKISILTMD